MDIFDTVNNLGMAIRETPQYAAYKQAEQALSRDEQAKALMDRYEGVRRKAAEGCDAEALRGQLAQIKDELESNAAYAGAMSAAAAFQCLMDEINQVLRFVVTGEAEQAQGAGCAGCAGGGCDGCGAAGARG